MGTDLLDLFSGELEIIEPQTSLCDPNIKWDYIVHFVVDLRYRADAEIIQRDYVPIISDMNSDCYFSECVNNARITDFLPSDITGKIDWDDTDTINIQTPGIYRFTFGVKTNGCKQWTACGYEYDAWEEYDLISQYKLPFKEEQYWENIDEE